MESINILNRLVSCKTDGDEKGINNCLKYVQKLLNRYGWKTLLLKNDEDNKNNLIAVLNGELCNIDDGLLLAGHIDTVVTDASKWNTNPLKLTNLDSKCYGLGVADMKNFTAAVLSNLETINKLNINKPIVFILTNDEETVMYGISKVVKYLKENKIITKYGIVGEPSNMQISTSNKGFYEFETIINGRAAHSSAPQLGINSIYIMSKLISFIEQLNVKYSRNGTTINVGTINGGTMCNVVPAKCIIRWDVRTSYKKHLTEINDLVNEYLNGLINEYNGSSFTSEIVFKIPPFEYKNSNITQKFIEMFKMREFAYSAATEAGFYQELGIDCAILGCGDINDCHAINEKIDTNDYIKYQEILLKIIEEVC